MWRTAFRIACTSVAQFDQRLSGAALIVLPDQDSPCGRAFVMGCLAYLESASSQCPWTGDAEQDAWARGARYAKALCISSW